MGIAACGVDTGVAKKGLDVPDIGAVFEQMGGKGVTETMDRDFFGDFGVADCFVKNVLGRTDA